MCGVVGSVVSRVMTVMGGVVCSMVGCVMCCVMCSVVFRNTIMMMMITMMMMMVTMTEVMIMSSKEIFSINRTMIPIRSARVLPNFSLLNSHISSPSLVNFTVMYRTSGTMHHLSRRHSPRNQAGMSPHIRHTPATTIRKEGVFRTARTASYSPAVDEHSVVVDIMVDVLVTETLWGVPTEDPGVVILAGAHAGTTRFYCEE